MSNLIYNKEPLLAVLLDPDKAGQDESLLLHSLLKKGYGDVVLVGGSTTMDNNFDQYIKSLADSIPQPIYLFPGNQLQLSNKAHGILLLSLLSGRNPAFLIGKHVESAMSLKLSGLDILSTAYLLIDGGKPSAVSYMTNTLPIPRDQPNIAISTAVAAELLGFKTIYLEAGSGALAPVPVEMIQQVKSQISIPLIIGGGIKEEEQIISIVEAGADIIVIGNILEKDPERLINFDRIMKQYKVNI